MNVFDEEWDETPYPTPPGWEQRTKALVPRGHALGMRLTHTSPEVVEYPDSGKVLALSQLGPLWSMHRRDDAVDYFDGEQPRL